MVVLPNHILIDYICSFPYRKECNYFQIALLLSQYVIALLFIQSEVHTFQIRRITLPSLLLELIKAMICRHIKTQEHCIQSFGRNRKLGLEQTRVNIASLTVWYCKVCKAALLTVGVGLGEWHTLWQKTLPFASENSCF